MSEKISIDISESAENYIKNIIKSEKEKKGPCGLYVSLKKSGCSGYKYYTKIVSKSEVSNVIEISKKDIDIYIDILWSSVFNNITIILEESSLKQKQLIFKNPNIDNECGCRESFTVHNKK